MKLSNGYGTVYKLSGKRRNSFIVKKTVGWHFDQKYDQPVQDFVIVGYTATRAEGYQLLSDYNANPYDLEASKITFTEVYEKCSAANIVPFHNPMYTVMLHPTTYALT